MAARESQGMQIALIIFVILTVTLGVTTYLFFDKFQQEVLKAEGSKALIQEANEAKDAAEKDLKEVKQVLTRAGNAKVADMLKQHKDDLQNLYPLEELEKTPTYPELVAYLSTTAIESDSKLVSVMREKVDLEKMIKSIETKKDAQIVQFKTQFDDVNTRYTGVAANYNNKLDEFQQKTGAALTAIDGIKRDVAKREAVAAQELDKLAGMIREKDKREKELLSKVERPDIVGTVTAQGKINLVNQSRKIAYISLGSLDGLKTRLRFQVFPDNNEAITDATAKATIEVTQVLGGHRAEARILDAETLNPVLPGDRIYNATWTKGQRSGFALAGFMDMDGDGRSDRDKIIAIIRRNGGKIDAQVRDDGRIEGKMTLDTDYLLTGAYPREPKGNKAAQQGYDTFSATATRNNTRTIRFNTYLQKLGYSIVEPKKKGSSFRSRKPGDKKGAY